jgi:hypothetical protein
MGSSHDQIFESIYLSKDTDLNRTLIMLKYNEEKTRNELDEHSSLFLDEVGKLSDDLVDEDALTLEDHKEPPILPKKKTT